MINWNTDELKFKKRSPEEYEIWRIVQKINYGLEGEKIDKKQILKYWNIISSKLDIENKKTLEFFLWNKKWEEEPGLQKDRKNFWKWYHNYRISENSI